MSVPTSSGAKKCAKCKQLKPLDEFYREKAKRDGRRSACKSCADLYHKGYRQRGIGVMMLGRVRLRAKRDGRECTITANDISIPSHCPVFGIPLRVSETGRMEDGSPSLDRVDNTRGYVPGNVMVISWKANQIKSNATLAELEAIVSWLRSVQQ